MLFVRHWKLEWKNELDWKLEQILLQNTSINVSHWKRLATGIPIVRAAWAQALLDCIVVCSAVLVVILIWSDAARLVGLESCCWR